MNISSGVNSAEGMEPLEERIGNLLMLMNECMTVEFENDELAEMKRRRLVRKAKPDEDYDYVISDKGIRAAEAISRAAKPEQSEGVEQ